MCFPIDLRSTQLPSLGVAPTQNAILSIKVFSQPIQISKPKENEIQIPDGAFRNEGETERTKISFVYSYFGTKKELLVKQFDQNGAIVVRNPSLSSNISSCIYSPISSSAP